MSSVIEFQVIEFVMEYGVYLFVF